MIMGLFLSLPYQDVPVIFHVCVGERENVVLVTCVEKAGERRAGKLARK